MSSCRPGNVIPKTLRKWNGFPARRQQNSDSTEGECYTSKAFKAGSLRIRLALTKIPHLAFNFAVKTFVPFISTLLLANLICYFTISYLFVLFTSSRIVSSWVHFWAPSRFVSVPKLSASNTPIHSNSLCYNSWC